MRKSHISAKKENMSYYAMRILIELKMINLKIRIIGE